MKKMTVILLIFLLPICVFTVGCGRNIAGKYVHGSKSIELHSDSTVTVTGWSDVKSGTWKWLIKNADLAIKVGSDTEWTAWHWNGGDELIYGRRLNSQETWHRSR